MNRELRAAVATIAILLAVIAAGIWRGEQPPVDWSPGYHTVIPCPGHTVEIDGESYYSPGVGMCDDPNTID